MRRAVLAPILLSLALLAACGPSAPDGASVPFRAQDHYFARWDPETERYIPLFVKGMNLGVGIPGKRAGNLELFREDYLRYFKMWSDRGINVFRIYTLHHPRFYEALFEYNNFRPDKPLYVIQGIWLDEDNPRGGYDMYDHTRNFSGAVEEVIDAAHGNNTIPQRYGRAFGEYTVDISPWVLGWVIGREVFPLEVNETNWRHSERPSYQGQAVSLPEGSPIEAWFTEHLDLAVMHERTHYGVERPVCVSSWPTLDPLFHVTENHSDFTGEDAEGVDLANLDLSRAPGGYFAMFHAYPYYPDWMSDDPVYRQASDHVGPNSYMGYLLDLKEHYGKMPVLIGEVGVPSSWGNAHYGHSGMNHGGFDEREQGEHDARLLRNTYDSKCAGALMFAWFDEWWKRTWIVDDRSDRSRFHLWPDVTSPEQNFGLLAWEIPPPDFGVGQSATGAGRIRKVETATNAAFFFVDVELDPPLSDGETLTIGFDTYRDDLGETVLPGGIVTEQRSEFAMVITPPQRAQLHVTEAYDLFGIWHGVSPATSSFRSTATDGAPWNEVRWRNNGPHRSDDGTYEFDETVDEIGKFRIARGKEWATSRHGVAVDGAKVRVRVPWTLLHFHDPSSLRVSHYDREAGNRYTERTRGVAVLAAIGDALVATARLEWDPWEEAPPTKERIKPALEIFAKMVSELPDVPEP